MMARITLANQGLETTRLGFGASRLHHVPEAQRRNLISAAWDHGFRHFDTAPLYGDGLAERSLGAALKGRRDAAIIATKAGLAPHPIADAAPMLAPAVLVGKALTRALRWPARPRPSITAQSIAMSLDDSLRRLQTDHVDLFLLHEPTPDVLPNPDAVMRQLEDLQRAGKVRAIGLAGAAANLAALDPALLCRGLILQTEAAAPAPHGAPADILYGALTAGPQSFGGAASLTPAQAEAKLRAALKAHPGRCILVSTRKTERVAALAATVQADPHI